MANISFLVKGTSLDHHIPMAWVTIKEENGGSLFFKVKQVGGKMGNLHGLYFDVTDESIMKNLQVKSISIDVNANEDLFPRKKYGTDLTESFEKNATSYGPKDVTREYSFKLQSNIRSLALSDFSHIQLDYTAHQHDDADTAFNDDDSHRWLYLALV